MNTLGCIIKRNIKLFFKDKGLFFVSLITPVILLILFITFLGNIYRNSFDAIMKAVDPTLSIQPDILNGLVGGQLVSSLLAVCCVTVAFCSNMIMVQDKANGTVNDFSISPVKKSVLALGYYLATFINTMIVALFALAASFIYLAFLGWFLSFTDILLILLDVTLLVLFGTALSSAINLFLSTQAQISAVGSVVSSMYGFICGAYMPMSQFPSWLGNILSFLPGTYGTVLLREHFMQGALNALQNSGANESVISNIRESVDCEIRFLGNTQPVPEYAMYIILGVSVTALIVFYVLMNKFSKRKAKK